MEDLIIYKEILKAIKVSKANMDLENDMNDEIIDKDFTLSDEDKILFDVATKSHTRGNLVLFFNKMLKEDNKEKELNRFKI